MSEETVFSDRRKPLSRKTLSPGRALCLGFLALILAGGLLLTLPAASADGTSLGLLKGMFTRHVRRVRHRPFPERGRA